MFRASLVQGSCFRADRKNINPAKPANRNQNVTRVLSFSGLGLRLSHNANPRKELRASQGSRLGSAGAAGGDMPGQSL